MFVVVGPFLLGEEVDEVLLSLDFWLELFSTLGEGERFSFSPSVVISLPEIIL